ncbi:midnolin-B isoform X3 [Anarhichas minor]|uniref:midnolin-B isoform X3 n=1 Tax=Anarhichas minor TaxID=65739 RepID=UPI003F73E9A3
MEQQPGLCSFTPGCQAGVSTGQPTMRLSITSTAGSPVELTVPRGETVEGLRTHISHKLRLQTDRIVLLYRDKQLTAGQLLDLGVTDGSKLTLVPAIEAGLVCSTARAERTMMDVLESLTEVQISDFLSGRSPLTIKLGIGAHMMYVQLELSAQNVAELQRQHGDLSSNLQTGLPTAARMSPPDSSNKTTGSPSQTSTRAPDSSSVIQLSAQRPKTSLNSTAPGSHSLTTALPHRSCPPHSTHTSSPVLSTPSLPSGCPHPSSPQPAATPFCSPAPTGSIPGPRSPASASTLEESNVHASSTAELSKQPGAVIESFVSPSPGVFSGTFSGQLQRCSSQVTEVLKIDEALWPRAVRAASAILGVASPSFYRSSTTSSELPTTTRGLSLPLLIIPNNLIRTLQPACCSQRRRGQAKQRAKQWRPRGQSTSVKLQVRRVT